MNVFPMVQKILLVADAVVPEAALPYFSLPSDFRAKRMRISAFNKLDGTLKRYVGGRCEQEMNVLGHEDERMQLVATVAAISINSFQEKSNVGFHNEESPPLPG
jgi:hypothetical protein